MSETKETFNTTGKLVVTICENGYKLYDQYNLNGKLIEHWDNENFNIKYTYDSKGDLVKTEDSDGYIDILKNQLELF